MKFLLFLLADSWNQLLALPRAVFWYIVIHSCAKYIQRNWKLWIYKTHPIYRQPFTHALRHKGSLKDCQLGLCRTF
jgi:hypothetical protein